MSLIPAQSVIKTLAFEVLLETSIEKTISALPVLGLPVIKQITVFLFTKVAEILYTNLRDHIDFKAIEVDEEMKLKAHMAVVGRLETAILADDEEEVILAENEYKKTFANLIRFSSK